MSLHGTGSKGYMGPGKHLVWLGKVTKLLMITFGYRSTWYLFCDSNEQYKNFLHIYFLYIATGEPAKDEDRE